RIARSSRFSTRSRSPVSVARHRFFARRSTMEPDRTRRSRRPSTLVLLLLVTVAAAVAVGGAGARPLVGITNPGQITINDAAGGTPPTAATPYPSSIGASGVTGLISKVTMTINDFRHHFPDDVDMLLVGPTGA